MNTVQFKLPDVGEGLTEADILTWKVAAGDAVKVNQVIVEIETAKSVVELPRPTAGSVAALLAPEGATVEVGTPIIDIVAEDAAADGSTGAPAAPAGSARESGPQTGAQPAADAEGSGATLVGYGLGRTRSVAGDSGDVVPLRSSGRPSRRGQHRPVLSVSTRTWVPRSVLNPRCRPPGTPVPAPHRPCASGPRTPGWISPR